jgi:TonB family protein
MAHPPLAPGASASPDASSLPAVGERELPRLSPTLEPEHVLAELRTTVSNGHFALQTVLQQIVEAAQMVTGANAAALAMREDVLVICRARAGDMAPDLGTKLEIDAGISGQCLRTGRALRCDDTANDARVDAEVCRRLGLRSLAVVPVGRKPAVSGVLEAFSALPFAFHDTQVELLEELAELVMAAERTSAELAAERLREKLGNGTRQSWPKRRLILVAPAVLLLLGWLVFRGKANSSHLTTAPAQIVNPSVTSPTVEASNAVVLQPDHSPAVQARNTEPGLALGVVMASKTEKAGASEDVIVRKFSPEPDSNPNTPLNAPASLTLPPAQNADNAGETAPAFAAVTSSGRALSELLSASNHLPQPAIKISQGLSGGTIERRVTPIYPPQARARRLEGSVLLQGVVTEDGTLRDLKVLKGDPLLAGAAMEAVAKWRYRPYRLNGEPIRMTTEITLVFKMP